MKTRLTVALDPDVVSALKREQEKRGQKRAQVVNEALRLGLRELMRRNKPFQTEPFSGTKPLIASFDCIPKTLEAVEGPWYK